MDYKIFICLECGHKQKIDSPFDVLTYCNGCNTPVTFKLPEDAKVYHEEKIVKHAELLAKLVGDLP